MPLLRPVLLPVVLLSAVLLVGFAACASNGTPNAATNAEAGDTVTVEGVVNARGNEPFSEYVLETEDDNLYVLKLDETAREGFQTPSRIRATGTLYLADFLGRPFTHLRVVAWEPAR